MSVMWPLSVAWYRDRLAPDYEPRTRPASERLLRDVGLTDDFWALG